MVSGKPERAEKGSSSSLSDSKDRHKQHRGSAPPGVYSRKLLEEETAKYKQSEPKLYATSPFAPRPSGSAGRDKPAERAPAAAAAAPAPAAEPGLRKWAQRYKAIGSAIDSANKDATGDGRSGSSSKLETSQSKRERKEPAKELDQRGRIIAEIVSTEEDYIRYRCRLLLLRALRQMD